MDCWNVTQTSGLPAGVREADPPSGQAGTLKAEL
jgi:hypothetical protein